MAHGNILSKIFYPSIVSEMLCLAKNTGDRVIFIMLVCRLLGRTSKQGSQKRDIIILLNNIILLNRIFVHHFKDFSKFAAAAKDFHILFQ